MIPADEIEVYRRPLCQDYDPEMWFPTQYAGYANQEAVKICAMCPVLMRCRKLAARIKPATGIWGGQIWINGTIRKTQ